MFHVRCASHLVLGKATATAPPQSYPSTTRLELLPYRVGARVGGRGRDGAVAPLHACTSADTWRLQLFAERRAGPKRLDFQFSEGSDQ